MKKKFKVKKRIKKIYVLIIIILLSIIISKNFDIKLKNNYKNLYIINTKILLNKLKNKYIENVTLVNIVSNKFPFKEIIKIDNYDIYIYSSHQYEEYKSNKIISVTPTVITASYLLKDKFEEYGFKTLVEDSDFEKYKLKNNYNYYDSYNVSKHFTEDKIKNNNFKLIIDLHRDSPSNTVTKINNKSYATILFVVGKKYDNTNNLKLVNKINDKIKLYYPSVTRGVSLQGNTYNQEMSQKMILLELGGISNTIEEISNTIDIIIPIIKGVLNEM